MQEIASSIFMVKYIGFKTIENLQLKSASQT